MNLIDELQKATGYWLIGKVDPNTQTTKEEPAGEKELLAQSAIPVSLLGLYHYTRSKEHAQSLVGGNNSTNINWREHLYGNHADEVVSSVASYAHTSTERAEEALNLATDKAIEVVNGSLGSGASAASIADVFKDNRSNILQHLPAGLQIGSIVNDTTLDDHTNKMEGPMSGFMHAFEKIFSDSDANDSSKQ